MYIDIYIFNLVLLLIQTYAHIQACLACTNMNTPLGLPRLHKYIHNLKRPCFIHGHNLHMHYTSVLSLLRGDGCIAGCSVRQPGVERRFSSLRIEMSKGYCRRCNVTVF